MTYGINNEARAKTFRHVPCIDTDVDMAPEHLTVAQAALKLCEFCARRSECLEDFKQIYEVAPATHGVWGGIFIPPATHQRGDKSRRQVLNEIGLTSHRAPVIRRARATPVSPKPRTPRPMKPCPNGHPIEDRYRSKNGKTRCRGCDRAYDHKKRHPTPIGIAS